MATTTHLFKPDGVFADNCIGSYYNLTYDVGLRANSRQFDTLLLTTLLEIGFPKTGARASSFFNAKNALALQSALMDVDAALEAVGQSQWVIAPGGAHRRGNRMHEINAHCLGHIGAKAYRELPKTRLAEISVVLAPLRSYIGI